MDFIEQQMSTRRGAIMQLIRPAVLLYVVFWYILGIFFVERSFSFDFISSMTILAFVCVYAAGNVLNDYFDKDIDAASDKQRPLQTKSVSEKEILRLYYILSVIGIFVSAWAGFTVLYATVIVLILGVLYSHSYFSFSKKGFLATLLMVFGYHILPFLTGYVQYAYTFLLTIPVLLFFSGFLLLRTSRLLMKDYEDLKGDVLHGKITPLVLLGNKKLSGVIEALALFGMTLVCISYVKLFDSVEACLLCALTGIYVWITVHTAYQMRDGHKLQSIRAFRRYGHFCILGIFFLIVFCFS